MTGSAAYVLSRNYTKATAEEFGAVKGASCQIKSTEKKDGQTIITFLWENSEGKTKETEIRIDDGTPIYVWESGKTYKYGDLCIYESAFYRCISENHDIEFDDTKWNEIGSPDGSYDIVIDSSHLPARFTSADRKMYYSMADGFFYLWNGEKWVAQIEDEDIDFSDWDEFSI